MKGISPLIAAVLLIAATVSLATLIMGWLGTTTSDTTSAISNKTTEAISCSSADITVDAVYLSGTTVRAVVKNNGFSDNLQIINATLILTSGIMNSTSSTLDTDFDRGEIVSLQFRHDNLVCANFSKVIVSTNCGSVIREYSGVPKGC
jgi:flagellin-like protein